MVSGKGETVTVGTCVGKRIRIESAQNSGMISGKGQRMMPEQGCVTEP